MNYALAELQFNLKDRAALVAFEGPDSGVHASGFRIGMGCLSNLTFSQLCGGASVPNEGKEPNSEGNT